MLLHFVKGADLRCYVETFQKAVTDLTVKGF